MAWNEQIRQLTTADTTLAENFNKAPNQLLENDKYLSQQITVLNSKALLFKGDLNNVDIKTLTNVSDRGIYRILYCRNCANVSYWILTIENEGGYSKFTIQDNVSGNIFTCRKNDANSFSDWKPLATTDKIENLFTGDVSAGEITLSTPVVGYTSLLISFSVDGYYRQDSEILSTIYPSNIPHYQPFPLLHYTGKGVALAPKESTPTNKIFTIQNNTGVKILSIKGIKKGCV